MKKPIILISPKGKTPDELAKEFMKAFRKFQKTEENTKKS